MNEMLTEEQAGNLQDYKQVLANQDVQEAIISVLEKLPKIMEQVSAMEKILDFVSALVNDKDSIRYLVEGFAKDLPEINLNRDTLQAAATLVNKLPKLAKYAESAEMLLDFGQSVISDKQSVENLAKGVESMTEPVRDKMRQGMTMLGEAKQRAKYDQEPIGIFSLLKLLKDPSVQSGL